MKTMTVTITNGQVYTFSYPKFMDSWWRDAGDMGGYFHQDLTEAVKNILHHFFSIRDTQIERIEFSE